MRAEREADDGKAGDAHGALRAAASEIAGAPLRENVLLVSGLALLVVAGSMILTTVVG
ncbi:hypothetical protein [Polymorphum gilvum]|uniref:hypothetical protein n=1 Tax=Polymorphum gilvum TaxID=991904 RepID=UPI0002F6B034|nr:hypothetical protein [Polymorphum gilvum]